MNFHHHIRISFKNIRKNKQRSLLTMLGIVIGIASVITILSLGQGFKIDTMKNLNASEEQEQEIRIGFVPSNELIYNTTNNFFTDSDISIVKNITGVKEAFFPKNENNTSFKDIIISTSNRENKQIEKVEKSNLPILLGENISYSDNIAQNKVVVIGESFAKEVFGSNNNAIENNLNIEGNLFKIIGIFENYNSNQLLENTIDILVPTASFQKYYVNDERYNISFLLEKGYDPSSVSEHVLDRLNSQGSMKNAGEYTMLDRELLLDGISALLSMLTVFIAVVASISLFIGGIGIMNMMYTSVSERRNEIAIRRTLGATKKDIQLQFLIEGLLITTVGGILGFVLGIFMSILIGKIFSIPIIFNLINLLISIIVSILIGLIFSIIPASSASNKNIVNII